MLKKLFVAISLLVIILMGIVFFNTLRTKPWPSHKALEMEALPDSAIVHMSQAIQIATISPEDTTHIDTVHFDQFRTFLEKAYPLVHQHLTRTLIKNYSYVFEWKGTDSSLLPFILMGHYDVVPVEASAVKLWTAKPFGGEVKDSIIWGRGSVDDKSNVISILEATEALLQKGFTPKRTILLCFGHNEESTGTGAIEIVKYLKSKNIKADLVLDEGGEISTDKIKDVKRPIAMIGVAEKGYVTFELSVEKTGGHSSIPAKETAIDIVTKALYKLRNKPTPSSLQTPVREFLARSSGSSETFVNKLAMSNLWLFQFAVKKILSYTPEGDAMQRTTIVPTILESGVRENVIPTNARAVVNSRIITGETTKQVQDFIVNAIDDERVKIKIIGDFNTEPSAATDINSPAFKMMEEAVYKTVDDAIPVPFIMLGATDSRVYREISNGVVNFAPLVDSKGYHGIDERLPIKDFQRFFNFITIIIKESDKKL